VDHNPTGSVGTLQVVTPALVPMAENNIRSIIEFGCGDGNQLSLAVYQKYIGLDVSSTAIKLCKERFRDDRTKSFFLYDSLCFVDNHAIFSSDLGLSMDVIYHLVEDDVFHEYMQALFGCSKKYVIVYSSNYNSQQLFHIKDRQFTSWVSKFASDWQLISVIKNIYPDDPKNPTETSRSDFYIFKKSSISEQ
jgi:SAM-dependent methyltransferase